MEDLLIECFYGGLIQGRLDQQASRVEVSYCIGRDIHPSELSALVDCLASWHQNSLSLMTSVQEKLERYKQKAEAARNAQVALLLGAHLEIDVSQFRRYVKALCNPTECPPSPRRQSLMLTLKPFGLRFEPSRMQAVTAMVAVLISML